jgi:hypothetical protein
LRSPLAVGIGANAATFAVIDALFMFLFKRSAAVCRLAMSCWLRGGGTPMFTHFRRLMVADTETTDDDVETSAMRPSSFAHHAG